MDPVSSEKTQRYSVLHIESDERLRELVAGQFSQQGFVSISTKDGIGGLELSRERRFAVIVASLQGSLSIVNVCLAIRRRSLNRSTPILAIAKETDEEEVVTMLDSGADDCLTVPFGTSELFARLRALLRRRPRAMAAIGSDAPITFRDIEIDRSRWLVRIGCRHIQLTHNEFELLHLLFSNPGVAVTRERLATHLWPARPSGYARRVDDLVKRLRKKVERDRRHPRILLTVRGVGYCAWDFDDAPAGGDC